MGLVAYLGISPHELRDPLKPPPHASGPFLLFGLGRYISLHI